MPTLFASTLPKPHEPTLKPKLCQRACKANAKTETTMKNETKMNTERTTMYIKNRRIISKIKAFGSYQTLCLTESEVLRNHLLFIY
jgi:hypothetical protein